MIKAAEQRANILYVDDTEANLLLFEASFENDYNIFLASSGEKGLEILRSNSINVLISDQRMPGLSGTELLEIVAKDFPDVMRFMLTAYTDYDTVVESINKGQIYGFFNKPFKPKEVKVAINKALEVYQLREKNKQIIKELEHVNKELIEMDLSRTKFLSSITGEIRNPVKKIMSAIHMLKDKVDASELSELLGILDNSVSRLENFSIVANQLDSLKSPGFKLKTAPVSLKEMVEISIIDNKNLLNENALDINLEVADTGKIEGEEYLLLSCIGILLTNAILHSPANSKIDLIIKNDGISITDGGENYENNRLEQLMQLFSRENPVSAEAGIDLVLANQIMRAHDGELTIHKQTDNKVCISMVFGTAD